MASAKVSRSQPLVTVIGSRNRPKTERTPKPTVAIRQPAARTTSGVRQAGAEEGAVVEVMTVYFSYLVGRSGRPFTADCSLAGDCLKDKIQSSSRLSSPGLTR